MPLFLKYGIMQIKLYVFFKIWNMDAHYKNIRPKQYLHVQFEKICYSFKIIKHFSNSQSFAAVVQRIRML